MSRRARRSRRGFSKGRLIKDLGFFESGEPATFGSSLFTDFVADHETAYVMRDGHCHNRCRLPARDPIYLLRHARFDSAARHWQTYLPCRGDGPD